MLAAKASLASRVDALAEQSAENEDASNEVHPDLGIEQRAKLENQLRRMEGRAVHAIASKATPKNQKKYDGSTVQVAVSEGKPSAVGYDAQADSTITTSAVVTPKSKKEKKEKKSKSSNDMEVENGSPEKKEKKDKVGFLIFW